MGATLPLLFASAAVVPSSGVFSMKLNSSSLESGAVLGGGLVDAK